MPGPGLLNELSIGQQRGLTLAVEDLNAAGGVLGGPVEWVAAAQAADRTMDDVVAELEDAGAGRSRRHGRIGQRARAAAS